MLIVLFSIGFLLATGVCARLFQRTAAGSTRIGAAGAAAGCAVGFMAGLRALLDGHVESLRLPWSIPYASFFIRLDALSAFFLCLIFGISALCALYGAEYLSVERDHETGGSWFFFNALVASMAMVVLAHNAVLFLIAWEMMSLASFFLVTSEDEDPAVRQAGRSYLIATHLGTTFLFALFVLLGRSTGTLDFDGFGAAAGAPSTLLFLLAVTGFGVKAGLVPFHVWLPEAHPAAPSHVSAVMSGVMIKTGIYGLVRIVPYLGWPSVSWGGLLIGLGSLSAVWGILQALSQQDIKRLLAYSSVENIGIITMGLGVWLLGVSLGSPALSLLGLAGALLHVLNHAVFKSLLFLGAGAVVRQSGTRRLDQMGGLLKRMPWTGAAFLIGAAAVSGLPPLNGFVSEFLIYLGAYRGILSLPGASHWPFIVVIAALALVGGLAALCFTKAFGVIFLGSPRRDREVSLHEVGPWMRWPMAILAASCAFLAVAAPWTMARLWPGLLGPLNDVVITALGFSAIALALAGARFWLLSGRSVETAATWGCGYPLPTSRMQYTASSFAQPIVSLFWLPLRLPNLYEPCWRVGERFLKRFRWLQHGRVQLYVLYIMVTLIVLMVWKLG